MTISKEKLKNIKESWEKIRLKKRLLSHTENKVIEIDNIGYVFAIENPFNNNEESSLVDKVINETIYFLDGEEVHFSECKKEEIKKLISFIEKKFLIGKSI